MDDLTTAVTLVTLDEPDQAEQWFATITQTYDEVADSDDVWAGFVERFPDAAASSFGSGVAEAWIQGVQDLTSDPAPLLAELADRRAELAALYWAELENAQAAETAEASEAGWAAEAQEPAAGDAAEGEADDDPFGWLRSQPDLAAKVAAAWQYQPEHYESHLGPYLESLWGPGWEQHPDDHKQAWLEQALSDLDSTADQGQATATAEPTVDEVAAVEQQVAQALAEALAEVPEAAELPDDVVAEVLAEVLAAAQTASSQDG